MRVLRKLLAAPLAAVLLLAAGCGGSGDAPRDLLLVSSRDGDYALFTMDAQGRGQTRLTSERGDLSRPEGVPFQVEPAWSPDGRRIAFSSSRAGTFDLYVMRADGTGTRRLTSTKDSDAHPTWSPDGSRLAFQRGPGRILVIGAAGSGARLLTEDTAEESQPAWSPEGSWIAYVRRAPGGPVRELWLARPDGSGRRQLTRMNAASYSPAWSPDGNTVAFASNRAGRFDLYAIGVDGNGLRRLTRSVEDAFEPAWSPDGRTIAFSRGGSIVTIDTEGNEQRLTDPENNDSSPVWNPRPAAEPEEEG
jgi:Tol biopolymer transport system component